MHVCTQQDSVTYVMRRFALIGDDVRGLERVYSITSGHGTASVIGHKKLLSELRLPAPPNYLSHYSLPAINNARRIKCRGSFLLGFRTMN